MPWPAVGFGRFCATYIPEVYPGVLDPKEIELLKYAEAWHVTLRASDGAIRYEAQASGEAGQVLMAAAKPVMDPWIAAHRAELLSALRKGQAFGRQEPSSAAYGGGAAKLALRPRAGRHECHRRRLGGQGRLPLFPRGRQGAGLHPSAGHALAAHARAPHDAGAQGPGFGPVGPRGRLRRGRDRRFVRALRHRPADRHLRYRADRAQGRGAPCSPGKTTTWWRTRAPR